MNDSDLIAALVERQKRLGMTDRAFAESIGFGSRERWKQHKIGRRPWLSVESIQLIREHCPDLEGLCVQVLTNGKRRRAA